jgi:predicted nucleotide-binding protein (sugar kinase/HSP70/actin superfamily)
MKVTFPHMGHVYILLKDILGRLDVECVIPPPNSLKTIKLGVQHAPELACYPLKVTLGNFIEGLEKGADTLIMAGGVGPCRFGYYAETQRRILERLGYEFKMVIVEPPTAHPFLFYRAFKRIAPKKKLRELWKALKVSFYKAQTMDLMERESLKVRPFEKRKGETTRVLNKWRKRLDDAFSYEEISFIKEEALGEISSLKEVEREVLKVGFVGEFYLVLEPFINFNLEEVLGRRGIYLERSVYLTDWIGPTSDNPVGGWSNEKVATAAGPYLSHFVGGEGRATVGHIVIYVYEGFDGILHLMPFTCMPELVARSIFPRLQRELDVPILSLIFDEQTGKAGLLTRIEAFIDLLWVRRKRGLLPRKDKITWFPGGSYQPQLFGFKRR